MRAARTSVPDDSGVANVENADPVPNGHRFDVVWRGYSRRQVREFIDRELRWLTEDRDAAVAALANLAGLLDESRFELRCLRERLDRVCQAPLSPQAVGERMGRLVDLARGEASDIVTRARAIAEHIRVSAAEDAARLAAAAEERRAQAEEDFQLALAARRTDALRSLREYEAACRTEADRVLGDARYEAARRVGFVQSQVDIVHAVRGGTR
jgi:colicin import membrane protein